MLEYDYKGRISLADAINAFNLYIDLIRNLIKFLNKILIK